MSIYNKLISVIFIIASTLSAIAQVNHPSGIGRYYFMKDSLQTGEVGIYGAGAFNTTGIRNDVSNKFLFGGYIDQEMIDNSAKINSTRNRIGFDADYGIYGIFKPDSLFGNKQHYLYFNIGERFTYNAQYNAPLFHLAFRGNSYFAGDTAKLDDIRYNGLRYQQIQAGILLNNGKSGIGISVLKGVQNQNLNISEANIFTANDGTRITADYRANFQTSNPNQNKFYHTNGLGLSIDYFTFFNFGSAPSNQKFFFEVRDLGFMTWSKKSVEYGFENNLTFEGLNISSFNNDSDNDLIQNTIDSLGVENYDSTSGSYTMLMPATFHIAYIHEFNEKLTLMGGFRHRINANYMMYSYLTSLYRVSEKIILQNTIAYGGYGGTLNVGFGIDVSLAEKWSVVLYSDAVEGLILPKFTNAKSVYFSLRKKI